MPPTHPTADDLTRHLAAHARCVRGLAAALLHDAAAADDVAQETLLQAWRHPPRTPAALPAFLRQVARRLALRWRRTDLRRRHREQAAARPETQPAAADAVRAELLQTIAAEVGALPPLLREVVLLRHYDDLPPRHIAPRVGASVAAVETRLRRAHDLLRARLRGRFGPRDLPAALTLFAFPHPIHPGPVLGAAAMTTKSKSALAAAAALLLLAGAAWLAFASPTALPETIAPVLQVDVAANPGTTPPAAEATTRPPVRTTVAAATVPAGPPATWSAALRGRVVDQRRMPVAGALVTATTDDGRSSRGHSDADGAFVLALALDAGSEGRGEVAATESGRCGIVGFWAAERSPQHDAGTIVLEPTGGLRVLVRRGGAPEPGALVVVRRARYFAGVRWQDTTDGSGSVTLDGVAPGRICVATMATDGACAVQLADVVAGRSVPVAIDLAERVPVQASVRAAVDDAPIAGAELLAWLHLPLEGGMVAQVPLHELVALPRTDAAGQAALRGFLRNQSVQVGAKHPDWQDVPVWAPAPGIDLAVPAPRVELRLEPLAAPAWRLVAGEIAPPAEGTGFTIGTRPDHVLARAVLRQGLLRLERVEPFGMAVQAWGPDCCAALRWPRAGERQPVDAPLRRPRRLTVELRDPTGAPIAGVPVRLQTATPTPTAATDRAGRVRFEHLEPGVVVALLASPAAQQEFGRADLTRGDGRVTAQLGVARAVRARVLVDGHPGLPGMLQLCSPNGHVDDVVEDPAAGTLTCSYRPHRADAPAELRLYGSWRQSIGVAVLPEGTGPAEVEFRIDGHGAATIDLVPPADGRCQLLVERVTGPEPHQFATWTHLQPGLGNALPRLTNLRPGTFRLRDGLSGVAGPLVEVTADGADAVLRLDLAAVVELRGAVAGVGAGIALDGIAVEVRAGDGSMVRRAALGAEGDFVLRVALDRGDLALTAVRGGVAGPAVPVTGAMSQVTLLPPPR